MPRADFSYISGERCQPAEPVMGAKKTSTGKRKSRKRAEAKSKGLSPAECGTISGDALDALTAQVEAAGGVKLGGFRDPLGGHPTLVAALPIDSVSATPSQRDRS